MDHLQCKACGSFSMLPMDVEPDEVGALGLDDDSQARFITCHVCGDNWLSVRRVEDDACTVTFVHQMGLQPLLRRTAVMDTPLVMSEDAVDRWDYYFGDETVDEDRWQTRLANRRHVLKAVCSN